MRFLRMRIAAAVCLIALLLPLTGHAEVQEIRIALGAQNAEILQSGADNESRGAQKTGLSGFNEMLAREICRRIAMRCHISYVAIGDILAGVGTGPYDLGFGNFLRTPEREKQVAFSDSIWRSSSRLLAKPDVSARTAVQLKQEVTLDRLRHQRIGAVEGTQQEAYLSRIAEPQQLAVKSYPTITDLNAALRHDQIDFILMPALSTYALIRREPPGTVEFVGPPIVDRGLGGSVHIAISRQKPALLLAVNQAIAEIRADGTYQRIARQFFPFSLD